MLKVIKKQPRSPINFNIFLNNISIRFKTIILKIISLDRNQQRTQRKQKERKSLFNPVAEFAGQRNGARIKRARASWRGGEGGRSSYEDEVCKGVARPSRWYHASSIQTASLSALSSDLSSPPCSAPFRSSSRLLRLAFCLHEDPPAYLPTLTTFEPPPREMAKKALDAWPCEGSRSIDRLCSNLGRCLVVLYYFQLQKIIYYIVNVKSSES